jgi:hypothetical protein
MICFCWRSCSGVVAFAQVQGMRSFDNRDEGTNAHTNALQDLTLVALHRNFQTFSPNSTLRVRFFLPRMTDALDRKVLVQARSVRSYDYCRVIPAGKNFS